jgi:hypothetical protein
MNEAMGIYESELPPGFSEDDVESLEDFVAQEEKQGNEVDLGESVIDEAIDDAEIVGMSDADIDALKAKKIAAKTDPKSVKKEPKDPDETIASRKEKLVHTSNIVDENGNPIDNDVLRKKIMVRPTNLIAQNSKLAKSGGSKQVFYDLTLPSYQGLYVDETTGEFKVVKTCPSAGECKKFCYAAKGGYVMFPASSLGASRMVNFLMNDPDGFSDRLVVELKKASQSLGKKGKQVVLRWHDSGDFLSEKYLQLAFDIAQMTPEVEHYAYTKQLPLVRKMQANKPENFEFTFSFGGLHDTDIETKSEKHARVIPANIFKDLIVSKTDSGMDFGDNLPELKQRVAKEYGVDPESVITYDELMDMPVGTERKWHVLVWKGHGDESAVRKDVLGVYLLIH